MSYLRNGKSQRIAIFTAVQGPLMDSGGFFGVFFFIVLVLTADWLSHVQGRGEISDNSPPVTAYHTI